ncbi:hypothetical protein S83_051327, partial [Arachis hypogaea]
SQHNQQQVPQITYPNSSSNDEMLCSLAQGQQDMQIHLNSTLNGLNATLQALASKIDSLPNSINQPLSSSGIPSQPLPNPKGGINAITLRSGTTLPERNQEEPSPIVHAPAEDVIEVEDAEMEDAEEEDKVQDIVEEEAVQPRNGEPKEAEDVQDTIPIPFSHLAKKSRKQMVPKYIKFLKDLCIHKDKINELETIPLGSSISALMGGIPKKCSDPGPCMVNCTIGGVIFSDCMCDLGACVSIMPLSIYDTLRLPPLKRSAARFVLADKSIITVVGITEDVLVSIKGLTFPIDFYILEMPPNDSGRPSSILLGRPFLKTSKFKLDAFSGTYSFEIDDRTVSFSLNEAMKHPPKDHSIFQCDIIDKTVAEVHQEEIEEKHMEQGPSVGTPSEHNEDPLPLSLAPDDPEPSQEPKSELKPLPPHLKYTYLEDNQKFPVIIARELTSQQEEQLLRVLRKHKKAIGWSLADIVGISPQVCEHRIFLEEEAKPIRQPQRRLNPTILEVVKKEVTRLLEADIIYPISDSEWKSGVTTIKNEHGELLTTRVQNSWRVCIDYRRLNQATRKDHYPLPFIDQILDRLS